MIHQDLTTWFDSSVNVDGTYIEGHLYLDDLIRSRRPHQVWTRLSQGSTSEGEGMT